MVWYSINTGGVNLTHFCCVSRLTRVPIHPALPYIPRHIYKAIQKACGIPCSLCSASLPSVKTWMEGTYDMPSKKKNQISS